MAIRGLENDHFTRTNGASARATGAAAAILAVGVASRAYAGDRVSFAWEAPNGCPASAAVEAQIMERVAAPRASSRIDVRGVVTREADGFRVRLTTAAGERTLLAPSCEDAANAVAVIVALAIDDAERARAAPAPSPSAPAEEPATAASSPAAGAASAAGASQAPGRSGSRVPPVEVSLGASLDTGTLPGVSPGISLSADAHALRGLTFGLVASGFLPRSKQAEGVPPVETTVALVDVLANMCVTAAISRGSRDVDLGGCVSGGLGFLPASTASISNPGSGVGIRPELWFAGRLRVPLAERFVVRLDAGPLVDPSRPPFEVRGVGVVHRPPALSVRAVLAIGLLFP